MDDGALLEIEAEGDRIGAQLDISSFSFGTTYVLCFLALDVFADEPVGGLARNLVLAQEGVKLPAASPARELAVFGGEDAGELGEVVFQLAAVEALDGAGFLEVVPEAQEAVALGDGFGGSARGRGDDGEGGEVFADLADGAAGFGIEEALDFLMGQAVGINVVVEPLGEELAEVVAGFGVLQGDGFETEEEDVVELGGDLGGEGAVDDFDQGFGGMDGAGERMASWTGIWAGSR